MLNGKSQLTRQLPGVITLLRYVVLSRGVTVHDNRDSPLSGWRIRLFVFWIVLVFIFWARQFIPYLDTLRHFVGLLGR
jgi:hypothetical protein